MPNAKSPKRPIKKHLPSISPDARDWGTWFVNFLELAYADAASNLPTEATEADFRRVMMKAFVGVWGESEAGPQDTTRLGMGAAPRLSPGDKTAKWTSKRNARRLKLIDKSIQGELSPQEAVELERLTQAMRVHCDTEEMVPLRGARRLHRHLLGIGEPEQT